MRVILIGVGGTANAILSALPYHRINTLTLVDPDWVEVSNLNRQFIFDLQDIGKPKAAVAAEKVQKMSSNLTKICFFVSEIQTISDADFFAHDVFILGIDNLKGRLNVNNRLISGQKDKKIHDFILIDTGSEKMLAHVQIVTGSGKFACLSCVAELYQEHNNLNPNYCSITHRPQTFEDCILPAILSSENLPQEFIYKSACERAQKAGIKQKSLEFVTAFLKNFSVNFSAVNSIIAGVVCEILMRTDGLENNYFVINCENGFQIESFKLEKSDQCFCQMKEKNIEILATDSWQNFKKKLKIEKERFMIFSEENELIFDSKLDTSALEVENQVQKVIPPIYFDKILNCVVRGRSNPALLVIRGKGENN